MSRQSQISWFLYALLSWQVFVVFSWHLNAAVNFLYPIWYQALNIEQTIQHYAPANQLRPLFEQTSTKERIRLFGAIVDAIQNQGRGLDSIQYHRANGMVLGDLLTTAEIEHLQDVAGLIKTVNFICAALLVVAVGLLILLYLLKQPVLSCMQLLSGMLATLSAAIVLILLIGPTKLFYWLHVKIFPSEHKWFFYYEESLMSMLMKAPHLFGPLALQLILLGTLLWWLHMVAITRFWNGVRSFDRKSAAAR